jgi:hypothetical protein
MRRHAAAIVVVAFLATVYTRADTPPPLSALARMPVKEVTVFKDGHAFVVHQGAMPTDSHGSVLMDYLPTPVLGTFWPFSADKSARLTAVSASRQKVMVQRTALTIRELIESNPGADAVITEVNGVKYSARIIGVPTRSSEEIQAVSPPGSGDPLPEKGGVLLLKTTEGVKATPIDRIQDITFAGDPKSKIANEEFRNLLTLKLDWSDHEPARSADVGIMYLQKGIRWIPGYKITIEGQDKANVKLEATLVNDMVDLEDVTANLVIGVPNFDFGDFTDPIAIQSLAAEVGRARPPANPNFLANSIATQVSTNTEGTAEASPTVGSALETPESTTNEDLFVFTVKHITMKKGDRAVLPIVEFTLPCKDVFVLDIPFAPPPEVRVNMSSEQQVEMARRLALPAVMHKIRLTNNSSYPLTTAPALIVKDGRVLAQSSMSYSAPGASVDLDVTKAVDIQVKKAEVEASRIANAVRIDDSNYTKINLDGSLKLTDFKNKQVEIEVVRHILGAADSASNDGQIDRLNLLEDGKYMASGSVPYWWGYYNWPNWWRQLNGIGRITWKLNLNPGQQVELSYKWHYFWR